MSEHDQPDPLAPELAALFAKESEAYGAYAATQDAAYETILDRLALVATPPGDDGGAPEVSAPVAAAVATKAAVSVKIAALMAAAALGLGVVVGRASVPVAPLPPPSASPVVAGRVTAAPSAEASPPPSASAQLELPAPAASASAASRGIPSAATTASVPQGTLAQERELVEGARAALTRGRPVDALAATDRHAQQFPRGRLAEEREVLAITALASLGRVPEAEARRARFLRAYPDSMLAPPPLTARDGGPP